MRSYSTPTHRNMAPEMKPWEIICSTAPSMPCVLKMNNPNVTKPMCDIDEYAMSFFMSVCTSATSPIYTTATSDRKIIKPAST